MGGTRGTRWVLVSIISLFSLPFLWLHQPALIGPSATEEDVRIKPACLHLTVVCRMMTDGRTWLWLFWWPRKNEVERLKSYKQKLPTETDFRRVLVFVKRGVSVNSPLSCLPASLFLHLSLTLSLPGVKDYKSTETPQESHFICVYIYVCVCVCVCVHKHYKCIYTHTLCIVCVCVCVCV